MPSFFSSRWNWDSPNPSPAGDCAPPFWGEGHTGWRERGWESPNSDEGTYTVVLFIYTYFVVESIKKKTAKAPRSPPYKSLGESTADLQTKPAAVPAFMQFRLEFEEAEIKNL